MAARRRQRVRRRRPAQELRIAIDCLPLDTERRCSTAIEANRHHRRRLHRPQRRRLPDARRAPQRRPHQLRQLRPRLGPLHRARGRVAPGHASASCARSGRCSRRASPSTSWRTTSARAASELRADAAAQRDTGERDRTRELRDRHGWAWTAPLPPPRRVRARPRRARAASSASAAPSGASDARLIARAYRPAG